MNLTETKDNIMGMIDIYVEEMDRLSRNHASPTECWYKAGQIATCSRIKRDIRKELDVLAEMAEDEIATPETRMWRTLVLIEKLDSDTVDVEIPAIAGEVNHEDRDVFKPEWKCQSVVHLARSDVPMDVLLKYVETGHSRFHAEVNTGASRAAALRFRNWELE